MNSTNAFKWNIQIHMLGKYNETHLRSFERYLKKRINKFLNWYRRKQIPNGYHLLLFPSPSPWNIQAGNMFVTTQVINNFKFGHMRTVKLESTLRICSDWSENFADRFLFYKKTRSYWFISDHCSFRIKRSGCASWSKATLSAYIPRTYCPWWALSHNTLLLNREFCTFYFPKARCQDSILRKSAIWPLGTFTIESVKWDTSPCF